MAVPVASATPTNEARVFGVPGDLWSTGEGRLDPQLEQRLRGSRDLDANDRVTVLIYMREQGLDAEDRVRVTGLPRAQRRVEGRRLLQDLAVRTQATVHRQLERWQAAGEASEIRPLWMVNAVRATVRADRVYDLLAHPQVARIAWDAPMDIGLANDATPSQLANAPAASPSERATLASESPRSPQSRGFDIWWQLFAVNAPEAWAAGYTGTGVVVAVIDAGVDYTHPDIASRIFINAAETPGDSIDNDFNGFIDDVSGWDFIFDDNDPAENGGAAHGTPVAGIVAGDGTSGTATGVAPGATILPVRCSGTSWGLVFAGLDYAVLMDADIIAMSVSQKWLSSSKPDYAAWRTVVENELTLGIIHSNSMGNLGTSQEESPIPFNMGAPANAPSPWLHPDQFLVGGRSSTLGVGAVTQDEIARDQSSRGPANWEDIAVNYPSYPFTMPSAYQDYSYSAGQGGLIKPDICAPGEGTLSTDNGGGYVTFNGTSAANPHVAGAMAILLQARPSLTPEEIDMILQTTARDLGESGKDNVYGSGLLDVDTALQMALNFDSYGILDATVVSAASGDSLDGCHVGFSATPIKAFTTNERGQFSYPALAGPVSLLVSRFGYEPDTTMIDIIGDSTHVITVTLDTLMTAPLTGHVTDTDTNPLAEVSVSIVGSTEHTTTDVDGRYEFSDAPTGINLTVQAVKFNYQAASDTVTVLSAGGDSLDLSLTFGMWDDFELDQGWIVGDSLDDAFTGVWERSNPTGTFTIDPFPVQPDSDYTAAGSLCFLTENCNEGAGPDFSDVDGGRTTLTSPIFDGTPYPSPQLSYRRWYTNDTGGAVDDSFLVQISSDGGDSWVLLEKVTTSVADWVPASIDLVPAVTLTDSMRIRFVAVDVGASSIVEAAVDDVQMVQDVSDVPNPWPGGVDAARLQLHRSGPNPFDESATLRLDIPHAAPVRVEVFDVQGRRVRTLHRGWLGAGPHKLVWDGRDDRGFPVASGIYFSRLEWQSQVRTQRMVRVN